MEKMINRSLLVSGVAGLAMLFGSSAMAFSVGLGFGDVLADRGNATALGRGSSGRSSSGPGLSWWSTFQDRLPGNRDADEYDGDDNRRTGDWFNRRDHGDDRDHGDWIEPIGKHNVAMLGIDRRARIGFFKKKLFKTFLLGWKLGRWFEHHDPKPIPLPAALLLFGSAFAGLIPFTRRSLRRKQGFSTG